MIRAATTDLALFLGRARASELPSLEAPDARALSQVTRGLHVLHFGPPATAAATWRPLMDRMYMPVQPFFGGRSANVQANDVRFTYTPKPPQQAYGFRRQGNAKRRILLFAG